jgi:hypothetical protein
MWIDLLLPEEENATGTSATGRTAPAEQQGIGCAKYASAYFLLAISTPKRDSIPNEEIAVCSALLCRTHSGLAEQGYRRNVAKTRVREMGSFLGRRSES